MAQQYTIGVVGLWHLGETFAAGLSELGHTVIAYDSNPAVIENFQRGIPPIEEPRVDELIKRNMREGRLSFVSSPDALQDVDIIWLAFDTPVDENDEPETRVVFDAISVFAPFLKNGSLVVITSQVPAGTCRSIKKFLNTSRPDADIEVACVPENLRLGDAVNVFFNPERIVIGADSRDVHEKVKDVFRGIETDYLCMRLESAEVSKHALNAFLATSLSFINDIADICEATGADILEVTAALKADPRIGKKAYLGAGLGFAGGTLGRDLSVLLDLAQKAHLSLPVISGVREKNRTRGRRATVLLHDALKGARGKTIAVFGLTYKAGTPTLRRSMALEIIDDLKNEHVIVRAHDPMASRDEVVARGVDFYADPYEAAEGSDAVLLITEWPEFLSLDYQKIYRSMNQRPWIIDTKNFLVLREGELKNIGFQYRGIGR